MTIKNKKVKSKSRFDITIEIKIIDNEIGSLKNHINPHNIHSSMYTLTPHEENVLANQLAESLKDTDALPLYQTFVKKFPKEVLLETLAKVLSIPELKIRKTRGAYFNYLMSLYERKSRSDLGY